MESRMTSPSGAAPHPDPDLPAGELYVPEYTAPAWYSTEHPAENARQHPLPPGQLWGSAPPLPHAPALGCQVCTARPVANSDIKSHTGLLFWGTTHTISGPLCRPCGIALVRSMTTKTLWAGWCGVFSLLVYTPWTLCRNAVAYRAYRSLPAPTAGATRSLDPGRPIRARPAAYVALIPIVGIVIYFMHLATR
jgi:hypothetical protein